VIKPKVVEVVESEVIEIVAVVEDEEEMIVEEAWVPPVYNPIEIAIESIDRIGMVTVRFNQPLNLIFDNLIVAYN